MQKFFNVSDLAMSIISKKQNLIQIESYLIQHSNRITFYFLLMMDIAKSETFKNFSILNKTSLFLMKLN